MRNRDAAPTRPVDQDPAALAAGAGAAALKGIGRDWFGGPAPGRPMWALWMRGGWLNLKGAIDYAGQRGPQMPDAPDALDALDALLVRPAAGAGGFAEGLWEGDVVELFMLNPATGFYMEFNLSPCGAWWCCAFDAPRVRAAGFPAPLPGVRAEAVWRGAAWEGTLSVPLASLPRALAFDADATAGNIAFCLGRPQRYVTLADLGGGTPDFHRPSRWLPLRGMLG